MDEKPFVFDREETEQPIVAFDLETAIDDSLNLVVEQYFLDKVKDKRLTDPKKIEIDLQKKKEAFPLNPQTGKIILGSFLSTVDLEINFGEQRDNYWYYQCMGETEKETLEKIWAILNKAYMENSLIVTFNGKSFDIPFLYIRTLLNEVNTGISYRYDAMIYKYATHPHFDLLTNFFNNGSLASWAYMLGISNTIFSEGSDVPNWYAKGDYDKVTEKCYNDIKQTLEIYLKIKRLI